MKAAMQIWFLKILQGLGSMKNLGYFYSDPNPLYTDIYELDIVSRFFTTRYLRL